jgi:F0F1-type ATP synthase assembly protein I
MSGTPTKRPLTQLNHQIVELESEVARLQSEKVAVAKDVGQAARRLHYLNVVQRLRAPAAKFEAWPIAVLAIGGVLVGILLLVLVSLVTGSFPLALLAFIIGLGIGAAIFAALLYRPPDTQLPGAIAEAENASRLANARLKEKTARLTETNERLQKLIAERHDQMASGKLQRAALLQRNWKAMRDIEWEDFVVEVCRTHGADVERMGHRGDLDANLIAAFGTRRVAIMTQGEGHVVDSASIQKSLAARERYGCDSCAVIVNRRFTGAAQDFAKRNGCSAIGLSEFPDFVLGHTGL